MLGARGEEEPRALVDNMCDRARGVSEFYHGWRRHWVEREQA